MDDKEAKLQLYKLEYEKAAERYDNIYRSIWTIFSYMTAIAGAILAFGHGIEQHALICAVLAPLLFWFFTTYLPLDRYGNEVIRRLGEIECILNQQFGVDLNHFRPYKDKELSVCKEFRKAGNEPSDRRLRKQVKRARFAIGLVFIVLTGIFLWKFVGFWYTGKEFFIENPEAMPVKVSLDKSVEMTPVRLVTDQSPAAVAKPETSNTAPTGKESMPRPPRGTRPTNH